VGAHVRCDGRARSECLEPADATLPVADKVDVLVGCRDMLVHNVRVDVHRVVELLAAPQPPADRAAPRAARVPITIGSPRILAPNAFPAICHRTTWT
jgi:hypothetical protein